MERNDYIIELENGAKVVVEDIFPAVDNLVSYLTTLFGINCFDEKVIAKRIQDIIDNG